MDSDDEIDFSNFKKKQEKSRNQKDEKPSLFGRLTGAIQNITGNKVLTALDMEPILKEFAENLSNKNVSIEIAQQICESVK